MLKEIAQSKEATLLETSRTIDVHMVKKCNGYFMQEEKKEIQNSETKEEVRRNFCFKRKKLYVQEIYMKIKKGIIAYVCKQIRKKLLC